MDCPLCGAAIPERATSCGSCGARSFHGIWTTGSPIVESTGTGRRALAVVGVVAVTATALGFIAWVASTMDTTEVAGEGQVVDVSIDGTEAGPVCAPGVASDTSTKPVVTVSRRRRWCCTAPTTSSAPVRW